MRNDYDEIIKSIQTFKEFKGIQNKEKVFYIIKDKNYFIYNLFLSILKFLHLNKFINKEYGIHLEYFYLDLTQDIKKQIQIIEKKKNFLGFVAPMFIYSMLLLYISESYEDVKIKYANKNCLKYFQSINSLSEIWIKKIKKNKKKNKRKE
jgi:hypothetical protein